MQNKITVTELKDRIRFLEMKSKEDFADLKEEFHEAYESLRPINLLKNTFRAATHSSELKSNLVDSAIGMSTGLLSQKLFMGSSHNPVKRIIGGLVRFGITNFVSTHPGPIKAIAQNLILKILKRDPSKSPQKAY